MEEPKAVETSNLTKHYGELLAVDHVNFKVEKGEFFGFLGPNGAGKSTTIRMLTGISLPTEGWATIFGYDIVKQPVEAKSIMGIVPDISNIYTELTAWENLDFTGKLYGIPKEERKRKNEEILKRFNLYDRRNDEVEEFSRGMRRRVCIGMALVNNSQLLFLDEPTAGLDVQSVREIRRLIRELNSEGVTVFLTTHNMEEASQLCDRVAIINRGRIVAIDTPERLRSVMRRSQTVEIEFKEPSDKLEMMLEAFPSVREVHRRGNTYRLTTDNPSQVLREVGSLISAENLTPSSINTLRASLEDVFVEMTGEKMAKEVLRPRRGMRRQTR
jgi:ABC-2 type transport system ATP-binding protein